MQLLSFFCGPGGLDEGFRQADFETLAATDIDAQAIGTFRLNHKKADVFQSDLLASAPNRVVERCLEQYKGSGHLGVLGGPPCQSFSVSNVHQMEDDPRHTLPLRYAAVLRRLNKEVGVSFFVFENVAGLLSPRHALRYLEFKRKFAEAGFEIREELLDAQDYRVPQQRPRIIIVGVNNSLHKDRKWLLPAKSNVKKTVRDAIGGLPEPIHFRRGLTRDDIPYHPNHWCLAPKSRKFAEADLTPGQSWGRSFRTLEWDLPSWTVAYGHREVHVHPEAHRRLSILEAMLLQTFPKRYELKGTLSSQIKQVSDAVPPTLAKVVAESVVRSLAL
jgi:DNA (cytosine-5)-methyltransferase 1